MLCVYGKTGSLATRLYCLSRMGQQTLVTRKGKYTSVRDEKCRSWSLSTMLFKRGAADFAQSTKNALRPSLERHRYHCPETLSKRFPSVYQGCLPAFSASSPSRRFDSLRMGSLEPGTGSSPLQRRGISMG